MIKIGTKKVNKVMIGNKEVLKIFVGNQLVYKKQTSPSYVAVISFNSNQNVAYLNIYDTTTGTQIGETRQSQYIMKVSDGRYRVDSLGGIQYDIRGIMENAGVHQGELPRLKEYQLDTLNWFKAASSTTKKNVWLKMYYNTYYNPTVYYNTQVASTTGSLIGSITNNDLLISFSINNNAPVPDTMSIDASTSKNGTTYNQYFTIDSMKLVIYFDYD